MPLLLVDDLGMRKLPATAAEDLLEELRRLRYLTIAFGAVAALLAAVLIVIVRPVSYRAPSAGNPVSS